MKKYTYNFSIIMSVYNVEKYIEEAIESLVDQSIGFKENVQLIIVNDGSTDSSADICKKYAEKYEENIEYYEKKNGGLSSARNYGLNFVKGKYINFMDPDDTISVDALSKVESFFEKASDDVNMAGLIVEYFGDNEGIHPRYEKFGKDTTIVNLLESPQSYILSAAATFYKSRVFDLARFDTKLVIAEDLYFNSQQLIDNPRFGIISHDEAVYNYRIRKSNKSLTGINKYDADSFIFITKYLYNGFTKKLKKKNIEMPDFLKYILIGEIKKRMKALNTISSEKLKEFHLICKDILSQIEDEYINKFYDNSHMMKVALYALKYSWDAETIEYKVKDSRLYANNIKVGIPVECKMIVSKISIEGNYINVLCVYNDIMPINSDISIRFKDNHKRAYPVEMIETDNKYYAHKYLGINFNKPYRITLKIPIKNETFTPYIRMAGMDVKIKFFNLLKNTNFEEYIYEGEPFSLFSQKHKIEITNDYIKVSLKGIDSKAKYESDRKRYIRKVLRISHLYRLFNRENKRNILINDRPMAGDDNGQAMFEYINKNEKKIAKNCYFIISKESENYKKLKKIGNVIDKGSFKHKIKYLNSKLIISSHANFYNPFDEIETIAYRDLIKHKLLFLQHGVIVNDCHKPINKCKGNIDMFVTSTEREREEILTPKYMYDDKDVILTGLPRFDKLVNKKEKLILIAPTWRTFLSGPIMQDGFHEPLETFGQSEYYRRYSNLLEDERLMDYLRDKGYKVLFLLYPGFTRYYDYFSKFETDIVQIKQVGDIQYNNLFNTLSLLITDYSSIMFDTAYLKKPILYYQFDAEMYFAKNYKPGYFSYENDGFGEVIKDEDKLIESIIRLVDNDCIIEEKYLDRINNTFKYIDQNNCKRVFNKMKKLL